MFAVSGFVESADANFVHDHSSLHSLHQAE